ncbi:MAG: ABC transporter permease [Solirubrobacteraceae bacterium]
MGTPIATTDPGDRPLGPPARTSLGRRRPVLGFLGRRLAAGVATLLVASMLIFVMTEVLPGDVASVVLGRSATPESVKALEGKLALDRSVPERYLDWLGGLLTGDLGDSAVALAQGAEDPSVASRIGEPMRNSAILAGIAFVLFVPLALGLGVVSGVKAGRPLDYVLSLTALAVNALPEFVIATFLIIIFFNWLDLFPPVVGFGPGESPLAHTDSLVLPVLTLLAAAIATGLRMVRAGIVEVMRHDYVAMAELNGFSRRRVIWRYVVRNSMAPSVVVIAQVAAYLVAGIIITENVFNYPGIGRLLVDAVKNRDVSLVEDVAMILATVYVLVNIVADLIVVFLIPKLRTSQT